jgi:transposase, IS30 family
LVLWANKTAQMVAGTLYRSPKAIPTKLRRTITYDNGTEFAKHYKINERCNMKSYFCDTHSPWQKGSVENSIGRLR